VIHAARAAGVVGEVAVADSSPEHRARIQALGLADRLTDDPAEAAREADLVVLAVPVLAMREAITQAAPGLKPGATVTDVGSGAGLPGIPLALARPDLDIELLEPLERRVIFLQEVVAALGLERVRVVRGRAENAGGRHGVDVVTARAVAPLSRLAHWCLPLLRPGGSLIALKGARAAAELDEAADDLRRLGAREWLVESCGQGLVDPPTTVIRVVLADRRVPSGARPAQRGKRGRP
jgi:16S rRNA (guanine527-N7)-methyltransferase